MQRRVLRISGSESGRVVPVGKCPNTMDVAGDGVVDGSGWDEEITNGGEDRHEALTAAGRAEFLHDPLTLAQGKMGVFCPVVEPLVGQMPDRGFQFPPGRAIGAQLVRDHTFGACSLLTQQPGQQASGGLRVPPCLQVLVQDVAILIDRTPEPVRLSPDHDPDLVQMPDITAFRGFAPQGPGKCRAKLAAPAPDGLIRDDDAAFEQHFLDQTKAQREPKIQPHRMCNQLAWKTVPFVAHRRLAHRRQLSHPT